MRARHRLLLPAAVLAAAGLTGVAAAPQLYSLPAETARLTGDGPGRAAAEQRCLACHSVDYVAIQPPGKGKAFWEAEVNKMITVYKAQIPADEARLIADYLAQSY